MSYDLKPFIHQLAVYLCEDSAHKSILLQMQKPEAIQWASLRSTTPISGWATVEEAEATLFHWFTGTTAAI